MERTEQLELTFPFLRAHAPAPAQVLAKYATDGSNPSVRSKLALGPPISRRDTV